jgi:hypothetical protein
MLLLWLLLGVPVWRLATMASATARMLLPCLHLW